MSYRRWRCRWRSARGTHFLVGYSAGPDRIDLHAAEKGQHLAGWRPYEQEEGDDRNVVWAEFLDSKRVMTLNPKGTLILWRVPECKAVYVAEEVAKGLPALSPDRKGLAVISGDNKLRVLNPETGEAMGEAAVFGHQAEEGLAASGFSPDGQELAAVLDGQITRWDLKTGQVVGEVASPEPKVGLLQYGDGRHVLLNGKILFAFDSKRIIWRYDGGVHATGGTGGLHRYVAADQILGPGVLKTRDLPDKGIVQAEKALADEKTKALVRPGAKIGIQVIGEPPRDVESFRNELYQGVSAQLRESGIELADGQSVQMVFRFNVKNTGRTIEFRKFSGQGEPEKRLIQDRVLEWEVSVTDGKGSAIVTAKGKEPFVSPGFMERMPPEENDWEGFLRARQFLNAVEAIVKYGVPYYAARGPQGSMFLPGRTGLGYPEL